MFSQDVLPLLQSISSRLSNIEAHLASGGGGGGGGGATGGSGGSGAGTGGSSDLPRSIKAFDSYTQEFLDPFVAASNTLGGDAAKAGNLIKEAWMEMRSFLQIAAACKEPPQAELPPLFAGITAKVKAIKDCINRNEWENHTKTCGEGVAALNWLLVKPAPRDFIESQGLEGAEFWANRIRKEYRTSNPDQVKFCDTFKALIQGLMAYVKEHHTTGVAWNAKGVDVKSYTPGSNAPTAAAPAPAAPASTPSNANSSSTTSTSAPPAAALFAALSKEEGVTSGLKKVTKEQQTWRAEYKGGDAPAPVPVAPKRPSAAAAAPVMKGPPKCEFLAAASRWSVENQSDKEGLVTVNIGGLKETVYILNCIGAKILIVGKCKSITVDNCKKTTVTFDNAMATCEVVNCARMNIHCTEKVSSVSIDKTDGIVVHLPKTSLDTEIVAAKSSEMNVSFPDPDNEGEFLEKPIPEQYVHRINGKTITADVSDLYGH